MLMPCKPVTRFDATRILNNPLRMFQDLTVTITSERPDTEIDIIPDENEMSGINVQTFVDQQVGIAFKHFWAQWLIETWSATMWAVVLNSEIELGAWRGDERDGKSNVINKKGMKPVAFAQESRVCSSPRGQCSKIYVLVFDNWMLDALCESILMVLLPVRLQEWRLHEHIEVSRKVMTQEYSSSNRCHPALSVTCRAARRPGYFYWNVFLVMVSDAHSQTQTFNQFHWKIESRQRRL